jgi:hypothetical protein
MGQKQTCAVEWAVSAFAKADIVPSSAGETVDSKGASF